MIAVVDYEAGNLRSVETALKHIGVPFFITDRPDKILSAGKVIFPGVGEASSAMRTLRRKGLDLALRSYVNAGKPLMGICLGSQIIFDHSDENDTPCLGLIPGRVRLFPGDRGLKIPQIGWNTLTTENHWLFEGIPADVSFYFVHSYYVEPAEKGDSIAESEYGLPFCAAVARGNLCATQFHPEKSGRYGLKLLANFCERSFA
jgi:glutamine amidotransferase